MPDSRKGLKFARMLGCRSKATAPPVLDRRSERVVIPPLPAHADHVRGFTAPMLIVDQAMRVKEDVRHSRATRRDQRIGGLLAKRRVVTNSGQIESDVPM
jgi:hypothetical protein